MMPSPGLERAAHLIAENVVSAVERAHEHEAIHPLIREALLIELLRALIPAMPTRSAVAVVDACNRCLDHFAGFQPPIPKVESVDLADGSVTMFSQR